MKAKRKENTLAPSRAVFRTPLLSTSTFFGWNVDQCETEDEKLSTLRDQLRKFVDDPTVREALFVASPRLAESLNAWYSEPDSPAGQKTERALIRYFTRMTTRCTPFGLFSAVSTGPIAERTALQVPASDAIVRRTRLDNEYLFELVTKLAAEPEVQRGLLYYPNSSLYEIGDQIRYVEVHSEQGKDAARRQHLVNIGTNEYLLETLRRAEKGARIEPLARAIADSDPEIKPEEATGFIRELVETQVLVPRLGVWLTGEDPLRAVITELQSAAPTHRALDVLVDVENKLAAMDADGIGLDVQRYHEVAKRLETLPTPVEISRLFQVDLVRQAPAASLGKNVVADIQRGIDVLCSITPGGMDASLAQFRDRFLERYGDREVPLMEVLDEESGIGFDSSGSGRDVAPLMKTLGVQAVGSEPAMAWGRREAFLLERLQDGAYELKLTDKDLDVLAPREPVELCDAFVVWFIVAASSLDEFEAGQYRILLKGGSGPSGAKTLGRFCHVHEDVRAVVTEHLEREQQLRPDVVFAEIVHLSQGRMANIAWRPQVHDYEIPFLGISGAPAENQIAMTDLYLSVDNERIVLYSKRLGKEIVPCMTNAHNYSWSGNLSIYRFLCTLEDQHGSAFGWQWGALNSAPFLPRVSYGRLVLSRARWMLSDNDLAPIREAAKGSKRAASPEAVRELRARVFDAVQKLREKRNLPRFVVLVDGDNRLPVDLGNILSVDSFAQLVKSRPGAELSEFFPGPDEQCVTGLDGQFTHELVLPITQKRKPRAEVTTRKRVPQGRRRFTPGSEWLYAKLYTGRVTKDRVLREVVAPTRAESLASGAIDRWFFIRYLDPADCVRVRFHGDPQRLLGETLPALHRHAAPLLEFGDIHRIAVDTYDRETERYGGSLGMELSEELFFIDSEAVLEIIESLSGGTAADARWRLALRGMEWLLRDMGMDFAQRQAHIHRAREGFGQEFQATTALQRSLGKKFRAHRDELDRLVMQPTAAFSPDDPLLPGLIALDRRSERLIPVVEELRRRDLTPSLDKIAWSYVHMHANRLLDTAQRLQEFVLYDLLKRVYAAHKSRKRA